MVMEKKHNKNVFKNKNDLKANSLPWHGDGKRSTGTAAPGAVITVCGAGWALEMSGGTAKYVTV